MTPGQEGPKWTPRQRAGLALGTTLAATLVLYIVLSMIHHIKTVEDRQLGYQQDLIAMGVENVQQGEIDNLFYGDVGTCSFAIEIKDNIGRAVFYDSEGLFAQSNLKKRTYLRDDPQFDEC